MVLKELLSPPKLLKAQVLNIPKLVKIIIVGEDKNLILAAF